MSVLVRLPFQAAIGALERSIHVIVAGIARACIRLGNRHFIMDVRVLVAQTPAAGRARSPGVTLTKPAFHNILLLGSRSKIVLQNRRRPPAELAGIVGPHPRAPITETTGLCG